MSTESQHLMANYKKLDAMKFEALGGGGRP